MDGAGDATGACYLNGEGVEKDAGKAMTLFFDASQQGHAKAKEVLKMYKARVERIGDGEEADH